MDSLDWSHYWNDLNHISVSSVSGLNLRGRLQARARRIFTNDRNNLSIRVTDLERNGAPAKSMQFTTDEQVRPVLGGSQPPQVAVRIISIYSETSRDPFQITSDLMGTLLYTHRIHPSVLGVLLASKEPPHVSDSGSSSSIVKLDSGSSYSSYRINYVEENDHGSFWSFRHTGVYHHHHPDGSDLFILLHPSQSGLLTTHLLSWLGIQSPQSSTRNEIQVRSFLDDPTALHSFVLSFFIGNWRWYLRYIGSRLESLNSKVISTQPSETSPNRSFDRVSGLRNLTDYVNHSQACCKSSLDLIHKLRAGMPSTSSSRENENEYEYDQTYGYNTLETSLRDSIDSCGGLIARIQNTIDLAGYTLSLHNQLETVKVDRELRDLTEKVQHVINELKELQEDSVDDSATVKIITFVSAVYLPGTFIVSIYGMNFFDFDQQNRKIAITSDFWIFIATWIPLTFVTGLFYILIVWFDSWWKRKPFHLFKRPPLKTGNDEMGLKQIEAGYTVSGK